MKLNTLHTLAAAIALTLLGSCSSDEVLKDSDGNQRIVFSVATENASRAADGYYFGSNQKPEEFFVWAQVKVGDTYSKYFEEQLFKNTDGKYVNDLPYFWPKNTDDKLKFYAFNGNPAKWRKIGDDASLYDGKEYTMFQGAELKDGKSYNDTWVTYSEGDYNYQTEHYGDASKKYHFDGFTMSDPSILFFQNEGAMKQTDLLYACTEKSRSDLVELNFRHALAMVCMEFQNKMPNTCVEILDFGTVNTPIQAKCTITGATDGQFSDTSQSGTAPTPSCTWSDWQYDGFTGNNLIDHTTKQHNWFWLGERTDKINQLRGPRKGAGGIDVEGDYLNASNCNATAGYNPGYTKENGFGYQSAFLMIPMKGTGVEAYNPADGEVYHQKGTCIVLKLRIKNVADPTQNNGYPTEKDEFIWVDTGSDHAGEGLEIAIPMKFEWEAGKKYIYKITFEKGGSAGYAVTDGKPAIVPIKLALEVDNFSNGGEPGATL
ncbi:MAG: hypothetical protein ACI30M_03760 [Muribaculaceae bacterium]